MVETRDDIDMFNSDTDIEWSTLKSQYFAGALPTRCTARRAVDLPPEYMMFDCGANGVNDSFNKISQVEPKTGSAAFAF